MVGEEMKFNISGRGEFVVQRGQKIDVPQGDTGLKNFIKIFDSNLDGSIGDALELETVTTHQDPDGTVWTQHDQRIDSEYSNTRGYQKQDDGVFTFENGGKKIVFEQEGGYHTEWEFDDKGNMIKRTIDYDGDGKVDETITKEYNEDGQWTKSTRDLHNNGKYINTTTREYDDEGRLIKENFDHYKKGKKYDGASIEYTYEGNKATPKFTFGN